MNTNFLNSLTNFLKKRTFELLGLILILTSVVLAISMVTYAPEDPSLIYGNNNIEIKNFFGIYGSSIADLLLQSFGLISFLLLANFFFWGIGLLINKEVKKILLKLFFVTAYLTLGSIFIYLNFNNSFWLIDNGNSGFVGKISYNFISSIIPGINSKYSLFVIFFLTITLFVFSLELNMKRVSVKIFEVILMLFKRNKKIEEPKNFEINKVTEEVLLDKKPQQSFLFENTRKEVIETESPKIKYKLPAQFINDKAITKNCR